SQFGGLLNFVLKEGAIDKVIEVESKQTLGSFNFINSYNAIGGSKGKIRYYAYYQYRTSDCWRPNSDIKLHSFGGNMSYSFNENHKLKLDVSRMHYLAQQPGGLTDKEFEENPRQSNRERNWFSVDWNIAALTYIGKFQNQDRIDVKLFGLKANRQSLGILEPTHRADPGLERNLISGSYNNLGTELKYLKRLNTIKKGTSLLLGGRYYQGRTFNRQGTAIGGDNPDFDFVSGEPDLMNYEFPSQNIAAFVEGIYPISEKLKLIPGIRWEHILTKSQGTFNTSVYHPLTGELLLQNDSMEDRSLGRTVILAGLGLTYAFNDYVECYGNFSENYRAINFSDLRIQNPNFRIDPDISDERGHNIDFGFRGRFKEILLWDMNVFLLNYTNRIGVILQVDSSTWQIYQFRSNIADSRNYGFETFAQINLARTSEKISDDFQWNIFGNLALTKSEYFNVNYNGVEGNQVEYVPLYNLKFGTSIGWKDWLISYQYTFVSDQFTDATNTEFTVNAVNGIVPAYSVMDCSMAYLFKQISFKAGINNLADNMYFTQRATGYPGPGIIPSAGRSAYITIGVKF
ncbi:MAG: TonB-dependent receptor, partial [Flavobacteriales bacterium]|nr:TonB-dependent receptor [Flavobacteriales bacterium]